MIVEDVSDEFWGRGGSDEILMKYHDRVKTNEQPTD